MSMLFRVIRKYWPELIVLAVFAAVYLIDASPSLTWMLVDSDGPEYVMDAKYFYPAHHTSAPLYLLMGHLFLMIPYGTDYWKMSLMSGVFTTGTLVFIYFIVRNLLRHHPYVRFFGLLAASIFGAAALVIGQAVIVETYAVVTFFSVGSYYFVVKKKWYWAAAFVGMGLVTHHLMLLTLFVYVLAFKEMRNWKRIATIAAFLIFYLYMPLSIRFTDQPNMWGNTSFKDFFTNNIAVFTMLVGQIAIYDFPKRILDTLGVLGISLGLGLIFVGWYVWRIRKQTKWWKNPLLWLFFLPIIYQATDLAPQVCFPKGTTVLIKRRITCRGTKSFETPIAVPIERVKVGDETLSYNVATGIKEFKHVTQVFTHHSTATLLLKLSNGNELRCTPEHPIAVNIQGNVTWVRACDIHNGDEVIQYNYRGLGGRLYSLAARGKTPEQMYGDRASDFREHCREVVLASYQDPTTKMRSPERYNKISQGQKKSWLNPLAKYHTTEFHERHIRSLKEKPRLWSIEAKAKIKATKKRQWQDSAFAHMMMRSWRRHPNKAELKLEGIIDQVCPDFRYNGCVEQGVVIGGRIPDFVNVNGKKKVIELFGTYWHRGQHIEDRIEEYAKFGFGCLVIWENELHNPEKVAAKVKDFTYNPNTNVVSVISIEQVKREETVYNLEVADNNNYFAYGILVHNCKYMEASIAWGAIITVLLLSRVPKKYSYAMCLSVVVLLPINANYFDIGRTMDKDLAATKFYNEELAKIPDGGIFVTMPAWEWIETYLYNKENNRKIIPVCVGTLASEQYQDRLRAQGVYVESISPELQPGGDNKSHDLNEKQVKVAMSIINGNSNVWVSRPTDPSVYGAEIIPAKGNEYQISRWLGEASVEPQWSFKPSNPYDSITGSIEVEQWIFILQSNRSVIFFAEWATFGIFAYYLFYKLTNKKKTKAVESENQAKAG